MNKVKLNFIYNSFYQILAIVLPLMTTPYISRVLGAETIGIYSYSYSIAYYFTMFIMLGLNNYGNRSIAMVKDNSYQLSKTFISIYVMQLIMGLIGITIYIIYAIFFSNNIVTWIFLGFVISALIDVNWLFFGLEEFKITVIRNTVVKIVTTLSIFLFVRTSQDLYIYTIIMVLGLFIGPCMLMPYIKKYIKFVPISKNDVIKHIRPNLQLFIPIIAISLYKIMDKIMLGSLCNMLEVGFYESSEKVMQVPLALVNSLAIVMLPKMSNLIANSSNDIAKGYIQKSSIFSVFMSSSICFGIMGVADLFVPLFYGDGYEKCIMLFQILMPSCIFVAFASVIRTQFLIPNKMDKIYITSVITGAFVNLIFNLLFIPIYGSVGAAIGTLLAEATVCIYQVWNVRKHIPIAYYIKQCIPFIIIGIVMYLCLLILPNYFKNVLVNLVVKTIFGAILYLLLTVFIYKTKKINI